MGIKDSTTTPSTTQNKKPMQISRLQGFVQSVGELDYPSKTPVYYDFKS
jgi:hypothetical protein